MNDDEMKAVMNETAEYYEAKMTEMWKENGRLKKEIIGLKGKNRGLKRTVRKFKAELAEYKKRDQTKPFYRNGRRGTQFNG